MAAQENSGSADLPPPIPASGDAAVPEVAITDDGTAVIRILEAVRFELRVSYPSDWNAEHTPVESGTLLVLEVKKEWVRPRQTRQPVLYAGNRPAEVFNCGFEAGKIVVVVPDRKRGVPLDLAKTEFFFGTPMLPERVTESRGKAELAAAKRAGIGPLPSEKRPEPGETTLDLVDQNALLAEVGVRIIRECPSERALGEGLLGTP